MIKRIFLLLVLTLSACSTPAADSPQAASPSTGTPVVLATTTFLADIAQNVAGDRLQVASLLPIGADAHSYQPTPQDVAKVTESTLLITNGADFEHFLDTILKNAGGQRTVVEAAEGLKVREDAGAVDPHLWLDPNNVIQYAENIRTGLTQVDPAGADVYAANAKAYTAQLQELDTWIREQVNSIPTERRLLVTNHDSLGYFSERYGFTVIGSVVEGTSSLAAPSAQQIAALIDQIKATGAPAVFLDAAESPTLAKQIASDAGVKVVTDLYIGSLTDGPPAATYIDMMRYDVSTIVEALK